MSPRRKSVLPSASFGCLAKVFLKKRLIVRPRPFTISGTYACSATVISGFGTSLAILGPHAADCVAALEPSVLEVRVPEQDACSGEEDVRERRRQHVLPAQLHD